jgi:hypothetical protein
VLATRELALELSHAVSGRFQLALGGLGASPRLSSEPDQVLYLGAGLSHPRLESPLGHLDPFLGGGHGETNVVASWAEPGRL